ncbi:hypothetical protein AYL99_00457 [Fonsecaea erecta]|uniref:Transcription factor domain-containing protein n=1 Tax=Fonsecaea erecta TaxID=1367422 RepID=A0A178ZZS9_9EURO|nr:hypothetical protein AYL99_00457 [Fonsecaea erecta]OAP64485.1 hypothetical protein AYL99_00457 [Fonsecaea erecta]
MATGVDFLFLVNTPAMYSSPEGSSPGNPSPSPPRITSQARSHAAMAFHRKRHGAMQANAKALQQVSTAAGLEGRALMPKPKTTSRGRGTQEKEDGGEEDASPRTSAIIITPTSPTTSNKGAFFVRDFETHPFFETQWSPPPLSRPVDVLPGVPHRDSAGFGAAAEFYSTVRPDLVHAPVFHVFDVSNTFAKILDAQSYYDLMTHEVALHAGVAVVNMVRDVFRRSHSRNSDNRTNNTTTGPSPQVLSLVQAAISKLRQHIAAQDEDPGGGHGGGRRGGGGGGGGGGGARRQHKQQHHAVNDDGAIIAALFLGHIASGFGDHEAFQMHRHGIKAMIESRGGLDVLGLDGMLKCSVLHLLDGELFRFESWWTHIYRDTSVFASSKPPYHPIYLSPPPYSAETSSLLARLPPGFRRLATRGRLAVDIVTVLSNIAAYQDAIQAGDEAVARQMEAVAALPARKRHADFSDACACLLDPAPSFEKYLVFVLICYASVAFAPDRHYLSASHTAFRTPRLRLTQDLPTFRVEDDKHVALLRHDTALMDLTGDIVEADDDADDAVIATERDCLIWMWLVVISSWTATDGADSDHAASLQRAFRARFPEHGGDWECLDCVLRQFFWTNGLNVEMKRFWESS